MNLFSRLKLYFFTLVIFVLLDFAWLGFLAQDFYAKQIGYLMGDNPLIWPAVVFYFLFVLGLLYFVVLPSLKAKSISLLQVVSAGAFFGLVTYGTYDLTNYATVDKWPLLVVIVDLFWGAFLTANVSAISFLIGKSLQNRKV